MSTVVLCSDAATESNTLAAWLVEALVPAIAVLVRRALFVQLSRFLTTASYCQSIVPHEFACHHTATACPSVLHMRCSAVVLLY